MGRLLVTLVAGLVGMGGVQTASTPPAATTLGWSLDHSQTRDTPGATGALQPRWEVEAGDAILPCTNPRIEDGEQRCDVVLDRSRAQTVRLRMCYPTYTLPNGSATSECQGTWSAPLHVPSNVSAPGATGDGTSPTGEKAGPTGEKAGPAAAFGGLSTTTYEARANTTVEAPPGVRDGDILILVHVIGAALPDGPPSATMPAGFKVVEGPSTAGNPEFAVARTLAVKVAAREPARYTVKHAQAKSQGVIIRVTGGRLAGLVTSNNSGTGDKSTASGVTTPTDRSLVVYIDHNWQTYGAATPPEDATPSFTERLNSKTSLIYVATGVLAKAGATGDKSHGNSNSTASPPDPWGAFLVGIGASDRVSRR